MTYREVLEFAERTDTDEAWDAVTEYEDHHPKEAAAFWAALFVESIRKDTRNPTVRDAYLHYANYLKAWREAHG